MSIVSISTPINLDTYQKVKQLGEGTFGKTYLYVKGSSKLAVKEIHAVKGVFPTTYRNLDNFDMIRNEIKVLKKLHSSCASKNVLCFKQAEQMNEKVTIITEYINGKDLDTLFYEKPPTLPFNKSIEILFDWIYQLYNAVSYIHSLKIIHNDIHGGNVMVDSKGILKLIDFGLAEVVKNKSNGDILFFVDYQQMASVFYDEIDGIIPPLRHLSLFIDYNTGSLSAKEEEILQIFREIIFRFHEIINLNPVELSPNYLLSFCKKKFKEIIEYIEIIKEIKLTGYFAFFKEASVFPGRKVK